MASAQVMAAPVHDNNNNCSKENKTREIIQDMSCTEAEEQAPDAKVCDNGDPNDKVTVATDTNEGQGLAHEVEAKLAIEPVEAEAKETKEGKARSVKKTEKASAKGAIVPIDDETDDEAAAAKGAKKTGKAPAKWAVVPVDDDDTEDEAAAPADQTPGAASVAPEEAVEAPGEEATKGGTKCEEKAHEE